MRKNFCLVHGNTKITRQVLHVTATYRVLLEINPQSTKMALCIKIGAYFVPCFGNISRKSSIGIHLIRCQRTVAEKLVYSEYGDPVKVVRKEKENLPAPKENEVFVQSDIKAKFIDRSESLYGFEWAVFDVITANKFPIILQV
jgi:hypothetical protein